MSGQLAAQIVLGAATILFVSAAPPVRGTMLAVPLAGTPAHTLLGGAVWLRGAGPLPGSLVIESRDRRVFAKAARRGIILLAAQASGCSTGDNNGV